MDQKGLLRSIAQTGYNVGFGAKKHFATYDIVDKAPGMIGFFSLVCGIFGLIYEELAGKVPSATLAALGVCALYISFHESRKGEYDAAGKTLTGILNDLRDLYRAVLAGADVDQSLSRLKALEQTYSAAAISKQILFSGWYAHYKFFAEQQIDWIDEQLKFTLRDKIPLSFVLFMLGVIVAAMLALARCFTGPPG